MEKLIFVNGDVSAPQSNGTQIIAHVCNDLGLWNGGPSKSIARRWPEAESEFKRWFRSRRRGTGDVQFVRIQRVHATNRIRVANMMASRRADPVLEKEFPFDVVGLAQCLRVVAQKAVKIGASVHLSDLIPFHPQYLRNHLTDLIQRSICDLGVTTFIYRGAQKEEAKRDQSQLLFAFPLDRGERSDDDRNQKPEAQP